VVRLGTKMSHLVFFQWIGSEFEYRSFFRSFQTLRNRTFDINFPELNVSFWRHSACAPFSRLNCKTFLEDFSGQRRRRFTLVLDGYYHLRQLCQVARSLSTDAAKTLVHAFVSSRLDYCNALLYGVSERLLPCRQCARNAAARLVTGARRRDHITPILRQLHWLPVRQRIQFKAKAAVLVFQCLSGNSPTYLADDCQLIRSTDTAMCSVRRSLRRSVFRNSWTTPVEPLPVKIRQCDSLGEFKRLLEIPCFGYRGALWHFS